MPAHQEIQVQRYELKYVLPAPMKHPIRAFVSSYLELDAFAAQAEDFAYPIHSIYFDSPYLGTYQAAENGDSNRFKLRLRYYDDHPESPVFLEMKQRIDSVIHKTRCKVSKNVLSSALAGDNDCLNPKEHEAHTVFCDQMFRLHAGPRAHVAYLREAWVSDSDNSVRVTMDTEVRVEPKFDIQPVTTMHAPVHPFGDKMVLELKYTNRFPGWFRDLVRTFHLMKSGAPKYSGGVRLYGADFFKGQSSIAAEGNCTHVQPA